MAHDRPIPTQPDKCAHHRAPGALRIPAAHVDSRSVTDTALPSSWKQILFLIWRDGTPERTAQAVALLRLLSLIACSLIGGAVVAILAMSWIVGGYRTWPAVTAVGLSSLALALRLVHRLRRGYRDHPGRAG